MGTPRDWLRLVRAPLAPTAACDALGCALLARAPGFVEGAGPAPLSLADGAALSATALLVYGAGMAGNDLADRGRDRTLHPERPLPSGRIGTAAATVVVVLLAAGAAALGGGPAGERWAVVAALVLAAAYDGALKATSWPGALAMGGVRAANAATGVLGPVLLGLVHPLALAGPLLVGACSAGITVLSTAEEAPHAERVRLRVARALATLAFGGAAVLAWLGSEGPTFGAFFGVAVVGSTAFGRVPRPGPVKAQVLEMLLGLYWLAAILASGGREGAAWWWSLPVLGVAYALILLSQLAIRALRR